MFVNTLGYIPSKKTLSTIFISLLNSNNGSKAIELFLSKDFENINLTRNVYEKMFEYAINNCNDTTIDIIKKRMQLDLKITELSLSFILFNIYIKENMPYEAEKILIKKLVPYISDNKWIKECNNLLYNNNSNIENDSNNIENNSEKLNKGFLYSGKNNNNTKIKYYQPKVLRSLDGLFEEVFEQYINKNMINEAHSLLDIATTLNINIDEELRKII